MALAPKFVAFRSRVLAFGLVGGVGFAIEAVILQGLALIGVKPLLGRAVSFPVAVSATWLLNKRCTFRDRKITEGRSQYLLYVGGALGGAALNVLAFVLTIRHWPSLSSQPVLPLIVGSANGMLFNYAWVNTVVFKSSGTSPAGN
jgi:putative flippase GtrA